MPIIYVRARKGLDQIKGDLNEAVYFYHEEIARTGCSKTD